MTSVYNLRTTVTPRASISCYPERTPEEYALAVAAKFGGKLPGWHELARLENKAMRASLMTNPGGLATHATYQTDGLLRYAKAREDAAKRQADIYSRISAALAEGEATSRDIAQALDYHPDTARDYLRAMSRAGMIRAETVGQVKIYSLPPEAAE